MLLGSGGSLVRIIKKNSHIPWKKLKMKKFYFYSKKQTVKFASYG